MNINFTGRHTEISPNERKYSERRIQTIEKLLGYPVEANIILAVEKYRKKAEINIKAKGNTFNVVEETQDMMSSLGLAFDNIENRVKKEKDKLRERKRRKGKDIGIPAPADEPDDEDLRVIRSKNYSIKPMSIEEAVILFESRKDEVFVFRKFEAEKWAVLYRRKDGHFGLIEPE